MQKYAAYSFYTPFFTTWFCALGINLFLPLYLLGRLFVYPRSAKLRLTLKNGVQDFKEKGFTFGNAYIDIEYIKLKCIYLCILFICNVALNELSFVFSLKNFLKVWSGDRLSNCKVNSFHYYIPLHF